MQLSSAFLPSEAREEPDDLNESKIKSIELGKNIHEHAYIVGKLLIWVRDEIGTTKFGNPNPKKCDKDNWVTEKVWFGLRTAYHFMAFAKKCDHFDKLFEYHPEKALPSDKAVDFRQ